MTPADYQTLPDLLVELLSLIRDMDHQDAEDAITEAGDLLASGDRADDLWTDAVLDGLRWGVNAAATVEMGGATMLRLIEPGGVRLTYEWIGGLSDAGRKRVLASVMATTAKEGAA